MPIYEYKCEKCGKVSEFLESMTQANINRKCKFCQDSNLTKIISSCFVSKGSESNLYESCESCCDKGPSCGSKPCWEN